MSVEPAAAAQRVKTFFCRGCGLEEPAEIRGEHIGTPVGWISMVRQLGPGIKAQRLGLYHSFDCLLIQIPRLKAQQEALGEHWLQHAINRAEARYGR